MNLFEIQNQVNKNKKLSFAAKALLNQIISFNLNDLPFIATNQYLAEYWSCDISTIKRSLATLKEFGYVTISVDRKKHTTGEKTWYNKRYISANYDVILGKEPEILTLEQTPHIEDQQNLEPIQTIEEIDSTPLQPTIKKSDIPTFSGPFNDDEENEGTMAKELNEYFDKTPRQNTLPYNEEALLELISIDSDLSFIRDRRIKNSQDISTAWMKEILNNLISLPKKYEIYRAIISKRECDEDNEILETVYLDDKTGA